MLEDPPIAEEPYLFWRMVDLFGWDHARSATDYVQMHMLVLKSTYPEAVRAFEDYKGLKLD